MSEVRRATVVEPSMVPLADMLTNTVGIMLFILIFTVLATAGAVSFKIFPIEHATSKRWIPLMCANNKIYSADLAQIALDAYVQGNTVSITGSAKEVQTDEILMTGKFIRTPSGIAFAVDFLPKAARGSSPEQLARDAEPILAMASKYDPHSRYPFFFVAPDSIEAFLAAREVWQKQGFDYGWQPLAKDEPASISFGGGGGRTPTPQ